MTGSIIDFNCGNGRKYIICRTYFSYFNVEILGYVIVMFNVVCWYQLSMVGMTSNWLTLTFYDCSYRVENGN